MNMSSQSISSSWPKKTTCCHKLILRLLNSRHFCRKKVMRNHIIRVFGIFILVFIIISCQSAAQETGKSSVQKTGQSGTVGGGCETCELMYIGMPSKINSVDTSAGWFEEGNKLLVRGKVFSNDGMSPASDIVLYYWHTDNTGKYSTSEKMDPKVILHGHIRGWVKTNSQGEYSLYTIRPGAYTDGSEPEHIHFLVLEPQLPNEYYIDDLVFEDDPLLEKAKQKRPFKNRGGSGIVSVKKEGDLQIAEHTIVLGLNIPGY